MLEDITDVATEALLQGFAPASVASRLIRSRPDLLYQQFALLHARISSPELRGAIARVVHNPHVAWSSRVELQPAGRPIPGSSTLGRALVRPGPRTETHGLLAAPSAPRNLERTRTDPSLDSVPNRFVKYALRRWRTIAQQLADVLGTAAAVLGPVRRGRDVVAQVLRQLDGYLAEPLFREVGDLTVFPASNQVLHKQHGYRQIFRMFVLGELGGRLSFDWDVEDAFSASQRNVATLYEYWCFLQLADALGTACGESRIVEALQRQRRPELEFQARSDSAVKWRVKRPEGTRRTALLQPHVPRVSPAHRRDFLVSWHAAGCLDPCSPLVPPAASHRPGRSGSVASLRRRSTAWKLLGNSSRSIPKATPGRRRKPKT